MPVRHKSPSRLLGRDTRTEQRKKPRLQVEVQSHLDIQPDEVSKGKSVERKGLRLQD